MCSDQVSRSKYSFAPHGTHLVDSGSLYVHILARKPKYTQQITHMEYDKTFFMT